MTVEELLKSLDKLIENSRGKEQSYYKVLYTDIRRLSQGKQL
jgi:hypothetical protein